MKQSTTVVGIRTIYTLILSRLAIESREEKHKFNSLNFLHEASQWRLQFSYKRYEDCFEDFHNNIRDTNFCDAVANIYDEMALKIFINSIAKHHVKRLTGICIANIV